MQSSDHYCSWDVTVTTAIKRVSNSELLVAYSSAIKSFNLIRKKIHYWARSFTLSFYMIYGPVMFFSLRVCPGDWTDVSLRLFQFSSTQNVIDIAIWLGPIPCRVTNSTQTKNHLHLFPLHLLPLTLPSAWQAAELVPLHHESLRERRNSTICGGDFVTRQKSSDLFL